MGLLPSKPDLSSEADAGPRVVGVDSEDADDLMSALTSRTARRLLSILHEEPAPPSGLADQVDTSLQNVQYHLERLEDAGAVEVVGTAYSEKGREMDLYAPADQPLVIFAGREEQSSGLRAALRRLVGGVGALAFGALLVQEAFGEGVLPRFGATSGAGSADGGDGGAAAPTEEPTAESLAETATPSPEPTAEPTTSVGAETTPTPTPGDGPGVMDVGTATPTPAASGTPTAAGTPTPVSSESATEVARDTATATAEPTAVPTEAARTVTETVTVSGGGGGFDPFVPLSLPPGALFFLGGLVVLAVGIALTHPR